MILNSFSLQTTLKSYKARYFEAARRWENRSILCVCEDFHNKADAKRAALDDFIYSAFCASIQAFTSPVPKPSLFFLLKPQRSLKSFMPPVCAVFWKASRVM